MPSLGRRAATHRESYEEAPPVKDRRASRPSLGVQPSKGRQDRVAALLNVGVRQARDDDRAWESWDADLDPVLMIPVFAHQRARFADADRSGFAAGLVYHVVVAAQGDKRGSAFTEAQHRWLAMSGCEHRVAAQTRDDPVELGPGEVPVPRCFRLAYIIGQFRTSKKGRNQLLKLTLVPLLLGGSGDTLDARPAPWPIHGPNAPKSDGRVVGNPGSLWSKPLAATRRQPPPRRREVWGSAQSPPRYFPGCPVMA